MENSEKPNLEPILSTEKLNATHKKVKRYALIMLIMVLIAGGGLAWVLMNRDSKSSESQSQQTHTATKISSFAECVAAGNPVQESYPEKCIADGQTFVNEAQAAEQKDEVDTGCKEGETSFSDKEFGAAFCYPAEWGTASVMDAKIDTEDTGYREAVRFSATTKFIVGGVSDDWTTTVGRDVACQEPSNNVPELAAYNTDWHDILGEGMAVEFAMRSLESSEGGYDITEEVSNVLNSGVCATGHKVINGSRYRVLSAAYYRDFSTSAGIASPRAHMENPDILFTTEERQQLDRLLASAVAY